MVVPDLRRSLRRVKLQLLRRWLMGIRNVEEAIWDRWVALGRRRIPHHQIDDDPELADIGPLTRDFYFRIAQGVESGVTAEGEDARDRILAKLVEREGDDLEPRAARVTTAFLAGAPHLDRSQDRDKRILAVILQEVWGEAFQAYTGAAYASYEVGTGWASAPSGTRPAVWNSLLDLHARACRVVSEIQTLQQAGLPSGAEARARSLHELAVVASVLQKSDAELTDRYRAYEAIEQYDDAMKFNEHCDMLGRAPIPDDELAELKSRSDSAADQWKNIRGSNGWASSILKNPSFKELEKYATLDHLYPFYRLGNHSVHAGPRASTLQRIQIDGVPHRSPGATVHGNFAETAHGALISLQQINAALLAERVSAGPDVDSLVAIMAIGGLVDVAGDRFSTAAQAARDRGWVY